MQISHRALPSPLATRRVRGQAAVARAIQARWCIDIKYGVKLEALALVQEWIQTIGTAAGLSLENCKLYSGAVGAPESRLELQVEFMTLAELETFWGTIPPDAHKAWSERAQKYIIDGSPRWELFRSCPVPLEPGSSAAASILKAWPAAPAQRQPSPPPELDRKPSINLTAADNIPPATSGEERIALDWKGDPMIIRPGDKFPQF